MAEDAAPPNRRDESIAAPHAKRLRELYELGRRAYGALPLGFEVFARRLLALICQRLERYSLTPGTKQAEALLAPPHLEDLYLAIACEEGIAGAWERFDERFTPQIERLARRAGATRAEAVELARELPGELCTPPARGSVRTHLGTYDGTGSLRGWLRVIVLRRFVDRQRIRRHERLDGDPDGDGALHPRADPLEIAIDSELQARGRDAMRAAWRDLTTQEALALLAKYRDGLAQREIARLLGVSDSRVSRILGRAAERIRSAFERGPGLAEPGPSWTALARAVEKHLSNPAGLSDQGEDAHPSDEELPHE